MPLFTSFITGLTGLFTNLNFARVPIGTLSSFFWCCLFKLENDQLLEDGMWTLAMVKAMKEWQDFNFQPIIHLGHV